MAAISLRLPDALEARLDREAAVQGAPRSEVARAAIEEFLDRRERERLIGAFVAEARVAYGDPANRSEALALAKESLPFDNEALERTERGPRRGHGRTSDRRKGRQ